MKMMLTNEELAEFIANHLPISTEDALTFIDGTMKGYGLGKNSAYVIACRDNKIEELKGIIDNLRKEKQ